MKKSLENSSKDINDLRLDFKKVQEGHLNTLNDFSQSMNKQIFSTKEKFYREGEKNGEEMSHMSGQMDQLQSAYGSLENTTRNLDLRLQENEGDVGFRFVYD